MEDVPAGEGRQTKAKFALDTGWVFASQIVTMAAGLLINIILGRFLGASGLGLYVMTLTVFSLASMIGGIGIPQAIVKYVAEFRDDHGRLTLVVSNCMVNAGILGGVTGLLLFLFSDAVAGIFGMPDLAGLIRIIAVLIPMMVLNNTLLGLLNGLQEMRAYSFRSMLRSVLLLGLNLGFVLVGWGVRGAVFALFCTEVFVFLLLAYMMRRYLAIRIRDYVSVTREVVTFSGQVFLTSAVFLILTYTDTLLVGYYLADYDVGLYAVAILVARTAFLTLPGSVSTVTYPSISRYFSQGDTGAISTLISTSIKCCLVLLSLLGILIITLSETLLFLLFGPEFLPAVLPMTVLVFGMMFFGPGMSVGAAFSAMNQPSYGYKVNIAMTIVNIALDVALIPILGVVGAAIGTSVSFSLSVVAAFYLYRRVFGISIDVRPYVLTIPAVTLLTAVYFATRGWINGYVLAATLAALYAAYAYLIILSDVERDGIWSMVRRMCAAYTVR
ncbi:MAG: flippase [Methanomicrobiaceae archaeon]|uniref:Uncharacterized protein n=1 Tax=hydrocarbon metagenome TaxID=938273 RepID=A0A0W8FIT0_9ZZZZ|nr:flippase [Methanomicrobiaceae archaeon]MDD5419765.1 flippase [Methanomicrobiaceae archaeon]